MRQKPDHYLERNAFSATLFEPHSKHISLRTKFSLEPVDIGLAFSLKLPPKR
jgi:hypothetical protein